MMAESLSFINRNNRKETNNCGWKLSFLAIYNYVIAIFLLAEKRRCHGSLPKPIVIFDYFLQQFSFQIVVHGQNDE